MILGKTVPIMEHFISAENSSAMQHSKNKNGSPLKSLVPNSIKINH